MIDESQIVIVQQDAVVNVEVGGASVVVVDSHDGTAVTITEDVVTVVDAGGETVVVEVGVPGPQGPQGIPGIGGLSFTIEAGENLQRGAPIDSVTGFLLKTTAATPRCAGLIGDDVASGFAGNVVVSGAITRQDWTPITGSVSLAIGSPYFVSTVAGQLTAQAPVVGNVIRIGLAVTTDTLAVTLQEPILLS